MKLSHYFILLLFITLFSLTKPEPSPTSETNKQTDNATTQNAQIQNLPPEQTSTLPSSTSKDQQSTIESKEATSSSDKSTPTPYYTPLLDDFKYVKCTYYGDNSYFSTKNLNSDSSVYDSDEFVIFNLCGNVSKVNKQAISVSGGSKVELAGPLNEYNKWRKTDDGIIIEMNPGEQCGDSNYLTFINLRCDSQASFIEVDNKDFISRKNCVNLIEARSKEACVVNNEHPFNEFLTNYGHYVAAFLLIFGFLFNFYGLKLFKLTLFCFYFVVVLLLLNSIIFKLIGAEMNERNILILLSVGLIATVSLLVLLFSYERTIFSLTGGLIGLIKGKIFYGIWLLMFEENIYVLVLVITLSTLFGLWLGYQHTKRIFITFSSILGSYLIIRGLGVLFGNYPNESKILTLLWAQEYKQLGDYLEVSHLLYYITLIGLVTVGIIYQRDQNPDWKYEDQIPLKESKVVISGGEKRRT